MKENYRTLKKTHTWDLVEPLFDKTRVNCKWIYNTKTLFYGFVERYKARLFA